MASTATKAIGKAVPKFRYLSAWFCPFAHRATLALEHHAGRVDYEWVEALVCVSQSVFQDKKLYQEQYFIHFYKSSFEMYFIPYLMLHVFGCRAGNNEKMKKM